MILSLFKEIPDYSPGLVKAKVFGRVKIKENKFLSKLSKKHIRGRFYLCHCPNPS